jgi:6-phosphofructokinase 1
MSYRLGVLTSGGDCPGLNAAIRAVVRCAENEYGFRIIGIEDAGRGLIERRVRELTVEQLDSNGIDPMLSTGGTFLGSINKSIGDVEDQIIAGYRALGIDGLIAIGGDGSMAILHGRARTAGWDMVGIPKTIDNDVACTDFAIGFDSAVRTVTQGIEYLRTTGVSHDRVVVLETMGRDAGHLALHGGLAGGADAILIPEIPYTVDGLLRAVERTRIFRDHTFAVVVVAEGVASPGGEPVTDTDRLGRTRLGGVGHVIADALEGASGGMIEARATVLGYLQRGGPPTPSDVILASKFGKRAVDLVAQRSFGRMVALHGATVDDVSLDDVVAAGSRHVDPNSQTLQVAQALGIYVGDR